ncbi:MAG: methionine--tRNA ligase subunit beta [Omnitrophica WOR_2 bacterium GWF2_38_59]|nr:MAG: methionine--tRNA ligase subunit beta [Omnitrophica WOR_2 bacterium GWF2_38_59]OGX50513.1 MAG: methionine--tRNA ligase subunit beta [Omnitrophica WOR_2 bacterium RIFOXYA2_FULL_38_17]OGX54504.1 MAG: methionine--tRNA ligase subunit beta [Omnitrophica WOR_2 bacterium RIFOXYA12_FULL_38_10]OGX55415.1 MAG: methionine--tRNA ligase subunit beta [Omnitrophica WOR_2 bacterium RIFOXYC2_FULL_38_12]OGX59522.1 MAG: methionine--tRNA ligase subunit beta [Omnitrophica WOR_2 bacterium RIFOXYB2_FULL_38_16]
MATIEDFMRIQMVTAEIKEVADHPNADRLYVLKVDLGEEQPRQIVAGIRKSYQKEELVGKRIIVIKNLEPAVIRGEESQGMLLAAAGENGPVILTPEKDVPIGSQVR